MNSNEKLIATFYTAIQNKNWKAMQDCYHDDIVFNDPVFTNLKGKEAKAMWHMLVSSGKDLTLLFAAVKADERTGTCSWEAFYTFSRTGRKVHNVIEAKFEFKDGKIFRHTDSFDLWKWTRMALGVSGILLGWSSVLKNKVKATAKASLDKFRAQHTTYVD
jgi:ketosteroid isomerase-like protein